MSALDTSYLAGTTESLVDDALEDFIQGWLAGVTGIDPTLVRPAWQEDPPPLPPRGTTWAAFAIKVGDSSWDSVSSFAGEDNDFGAGDFGGGLFGDNPIPSASTQTKFEKLETTCSFYGPASGGMAMALRMGAGIGQNRDALRAQAMAFVGVGPATTVSEKIKGKFVRRIDVELVLRRTVQFSYAVPQIVSATGQLITDQTLPTSLAIVAAGAPANVPLDPTNPA
jgi:hypothetical protein